MCQRWGNTLFAFNTMIGQNEPHRRRSHRREVLHSLRRLELHERSSSRDILARKERSQTRERSIVELSAAIPKIITAVR